jgi:hypothetical protein
VVLNATSCVEIGRIVWHDLVYLLGQNIFRLAIRKTRDPLVVTKKTSIKINPERLNLCPYLVIRIQDNAI